MYLNLEAHISDEMSHTSQTLIKTNAIYDVHILHKSYWEWNVA